MTEDTRLEPADCPLCGASVKTPTPYRSAHLRIVRCASCRVYYLSPRLIESEMIASYRDAAYFEAAALGDVGAGYASYERQERSLRKTFYRLVERLDGRGLTGGTLLEVGCGYGYFLEAARGRFSRRVGTEMSAGAAAVARRSAAEIHVGGLDALPGGERFDLAVALHVIEHVYEPIPFVEGVLRHVKRRGHLLLATPDMGSAWRRLLGRAWPSFKYPEHVVLYDRETLARLMNSVPGLVHVRRVPYPHAFPLGDVLAKLGLPAPPKLDRLPIWIPGTTIALLARFEGDETS